jgi:hypothetical protein
LRNYFGAIGVTNLCDEKVTNLQGTFAAIFIIIVAVAGVSFCMDADSKPQFNQSLPGGKENDMIAQKKTPPLGPIFLGAAIFAR